MTYVRVNSEQFWRVIAPLDVHPKMLGQYPYLSVFETPDGKERGRIEASFVAGRVVNTYYLTEEK